MTFPASDLNGWAGFEDDFVLDPDDAGLDLDEWYDDYVQDIITRLKPTHDTWVTRKGKRVLVTEMEDAHLLNTIKMIERNKAEALPTYPSLLMEATARNLDLDKSVLSSNLRKKLSRLRDNLHVSSEFVTSLEASIQDSLDAAFKRGERKALSRKAAIDKP